MFHEIGYDATTVEAVIKKAQVTEAEFYQYFETKDDLEHTLGDLFDEKYAQLMVSMNPRYTNFDKLVYLNREMFKLIEEKVPFDLICHIYAGKTVEQQELLSSDRFYYQLITRIIRDGQESGEFSKEESAEELAENYASLERGIIYDWCVKNGSGSLLKKGQSILSIYLEHILL